MLQNKLCFASGLFLEGGLLPDAWQGHFVFQWNIPLLLWRLPSEVFSFRELYHGCDLRGLLLQENL